jgi:hypothetical protein
MTELKELFKTIDAEPAPDLSSVIATRARHYSQVPGSLGAEDPGIRRRPAIEPLRLMAAAAVIVIAAGLVVILQWRAAGPAKHRPTPPPSTSISGVCPSDGCVLSPGTYSVDWNAKLTFSISHPSHVFYSTSGFEDLQLSRDSKPAALADHYSNTVLWVGLNPAAGSYTVCPLQSTGSMPAANNPARTPAQMADWFVRHPGLATSNVHAVEVGGLEGIVLDAVDADGSRCPPPLLAIPEMNYPWDLWGIQQGEKGRLYLLWEPKAKITIAIGIKAGRSDFDHVINEFEPVIESFIFS